MSRTNPRKPKPRQANRTAQIVVEGYTEEAFCRHLKTLFAKNCGIRIEIKNVRGGSPLDVVRTALNRPGYDQTFVVYDTDVPLPRTWAAKSRKAKHIPIPTSPCIEALFLYLLGEVVPDNTEDCKRRFSKILDDKKKCEPKSYHKLFPAEILTKSNHPSIVGLLSIFL